MINELKAEAYDLISQLEELQMKTVELRKKLVEINQKIEQAKSQESI